MHTCPDCYQPCTCGGDIDDIQFDNPPCGSCACDCWQEDAGYDYDPDEDDGGEECDYCGRTLSWGGNRTPGGAIACDDCEVDTWGTIGGRPADKRCQGCERMTDWTHDGLCVDCDNDRDLLNQRKERT